MLSTSPIPLYYQVANVLRHRILDGVYGPGERIGTQEELCERFGVSRITIRRALGGLERDGLIVTRRRLGTFVSQHVPRMASFSFSGFLEELFAQVLLTEAREVNIQQVQAHGEVVQALQVAEGDTVVRIERVRFMQGSPFAHTVNYLPLAVGGGITADDLRELPLMHILEHRLQIHLEEAVQTIRAVPATPDLADKLTIPAGSPLLLVQRTVMAEGGPVEYVLTHYRADRYQYTVRLGRIRRGER